MARPPVARRMGQAEWVESNKHVARTVDRQPMRIGGAGSSPMQLAAKRSGRAIPSHQASLPNPTFSSVPPFSTKLPAPFRSQPLVPSLLHFSSFQACNTSRGELHLPPPTILILVHLPIPAAAAPELQLACCLLCF